MYKPQTFLDNFKVTQGILYLNNKYIVRIIRTNNNNRNTYTLGVFNNLDEAVLLYRNYFDKDSKEIENYITISLLGNLKNTKTGYFEVSCHSARAKTNPYNARVAVNKNRVHLGVFATAKETAIAYNNYLLEHNLVTYNRPLNIIKDNV